MAETEYLNKSFTLDAETYRRLKVLAGESDRSESAMVRVCINREWERTHGTGPLPALPDGEGKE